MYIGTFTNRVSVCLVAEQLADRHTHVNTFDDGIGTALVTDSLVDPDKYL